MPQAWEWRRGRHADLYTLSLGHSGLQSWVSDLSLHPLYPTIQGSPDSCKYPKHTKKQGTKHWALLYCYIFILISLRASGGLVHLQCRRPRFDPWFRKIPWRRKWQPTPVFLPGKSHGQRSLGGDSPWGCKSQTRLSNWTTTTTSFIIQRGLSQPFIHTEAQRKAVHQIIGR